MIGSRFGRLTIVGEIKKHNGIENRLYFQCVCDCGREKEILAHSVKTGLTKSCGCLNREIVIDRSTKLGMSRTRFCKIWYGMRQRCENENQDCYKDYGGRGIRVEDDWHDFENFYNDMYTSYLEHVEKYGEEQTSIERVDVNGNYSRDNCTWATRKEQVLNRRKRKDNKSGVTGVSFDKKANKWRVQMNINGKRCCLGFFSSLDDAVKARNSAEEKYFGKESDN